MSQLLPGMEPGNLTWNSQNPKNPITEFFKGILRDSGIKLSPNEDPNILTQEQALVVRDIEKLLEGADPANPSDKFLRGFKILVSKEKYLKKALLPTLFRKTEVEIQQESLFRILLKVTLLQNEIIEILTDKLTSTVSDDEQDVSHLRLLLSQLRYLPHIKHPQNLTSKILDIIDIASYPSQLEILDSLPEILPDSEYTETAKELTKMLDKNDDLSGAIIDCLNALSLNGEIRAQIQDHILSKILTGTSTKMFPIFLDFLLSDYNSKSLAGILVKIRNALNVITASRDKNDKEKESSKVVIYNRLQKAAVLKQVSEGWISVISNIKTHTDHKPIDLIILFMLHKCTKLKKRIVETTFRKRIKDGQFKCNLLEQLFLKYLNQQLLRDYFTSITEIGSSLLRSSEDPLVTDFASTLFKLLFTSEHIERIFQQEILENLVVLVGANDQKKITPILNILVDLSEDIPKSPNHAITLMRLLERLDTFELEDVKLVFEILCRVTCHEESLLGLKEELRMIVRKHLSSAKRCLKYRGIISAVIMAKHLATTDDHSDMFDESINITQLQGGAQDAAAILELTNTSTLGQPELMAFYYDQLAEIMVKSEHLDRNLLGWLDKTVTGDFQTVYAAETVCEDLDDLQFSNQYNLNSEEDLAINVAELTLKSEHSILVLAPHFRLLRLLHYRQQNGDLSTIDALLGCGVILPKLEQIDNLGCEQLKLVSDCLFHCINWFRETISGFVTQKEDRLRRLVIQRVDDLNELEKILAQCLENVPHHKLPHSYFNESSPSTSSKKEVFKAPRKKLKTGTAEETTVATTSNVKTLKKNKDEQKLNFREMDTDLVKLLMYPLKSASSSEGQITLNLNQLIFILKDFVTKLEMVTKRQLGLSHLTIVTPSEFMRDCGNILMNINEHFGVVLKNLDREKDAESDEDDDDEIDERFETSFGLILKSLSFIFSWSGFQHSKHLDLLRDLLKAFRSEISSTLLNSVNHLIIDLTNRLSDYTDYCSSLTHAVDLIKTMEALHAVSSNSQPVRSKIAKTALKLLNKEWRTQNSSNVDILIKSYLSSANIKTIGGMVATLKDQVTSLQNKSDSLQMLKSVTKANFYVLYRNLWTSLHERVKIEIESLTNSQHLTLWQNTAITMKGLMTVAKTQETKLNLVCFLKKSIAILKIFLSHGIPILEIELKSEPDRVIEIFKTIQSNTRFLHQLCCFSKVTKDSSLMAHVPQFRLTLESLIYRVKAALVANGCSDAFWMGNLRNRDLEGEDILSQSQSTENSTRGEDEEMPSDEELDDDDDDSDGATNSRGSEVFQ